MLQIIATNTTDEQQTIDDNIIQLLAMLKPIWQDTKQETNETIYKNKCRKHTKQSL